MKENQYLLVRNQVRVDEKKIDKDEIKAIIKQKPNRRILGIFRFHLGVYNFASSGRERKYKTNIKETVGEPPSILDSSLTEKSTSQIKLFLNKKGYFNSIVEDATIAKNRKAKVIYNITAGEPYKIRKINYEIEDPVINSLVSLNTNSLINEGTNFDEYILEAERARITRLLNNSGYYYFSKEYINYKADTALGNHLVDLVLKVNNVSELIDGQDTVAVFHKKYWINDVYVQTEYNPKQVDSTASDTITSNEYYFLYRNRMRFKTSPLLDNIYLKKGELYQIRNTDLSYRRLGDLRVFKFVNIQYRPIPSDSTNLLNAYIFLTPQDKQSYAFEIEGTFSNGTYGLAGNIIYQNKNLFRGIERLEIKFKGGLEVHRLIDGTTDGNAVNSKLATTVEIGPEMTLTMPKFFIPLKLTGFSKKYRPKTNLSFAYNYQERPDYTRSIVSTTFGYTWRSTSRVRHILNPLEINYVQIDLRPSLEAKINRLRDVLLKGSYSDYFITGSKYSIIFNNQNYTKKKSFSYLRFNIEVAGNLLYLASRALTDSVDKRSDFRIDTIAFAQFVRPDIDYRYYDVLNDWSTLVFRSALGVGYAYSNTRVLPIQKSFFSGGANGMRAWKSRSIGPGSLPDSLSINLDQFGDIQLELNLEYRFNIYKYLKGAFFMDAGNVWLIRQDTLRPGGWFLSETGPSQGHFSIEKFSKEIAFGCGTGARFDFSFFVVRFDLGLKVYDPAIVEGNRWVIQYLFNKPWKDTYESTNLLRYPFLNLSFGIGYPF